MDNGNKTFLGAIVAAVRSFCMLFINAVEVADDAVAMADKAVKAARKRQAVEIDIDMDNFAAAAREKHALRRVKAKLEMDEFIGGDPERQKLIDDARTHIDAIIAKSIAEVERKRN